MSKSHPAILNISQPLQTEKLPEILDKFVKTQNNSNKGILFFILIKDYIKRTEIQTCAH